MPGQIEHRYRACHLCEAVCGLDFRFEDGALTAIRGDRQDPFSRGFVCPKGNAILDLERDPDRLRRPMRRRGDGFEEIGWDEAIALAADRLTGIQKSHGNDALGIYLGNPNVHSFGSLAYLPPLLKLLRSRNTFSASSVDQWPHQLVNWLMFGHQFLLPIPDLDRTDYLLMLGANPAASNGSLMTAPGIPDRLKALTRRGKLVVVDPRRTETAAVASEHLSIRPGGDALFLIGLINALAGVGPPRLERYGNRLNGFEEATAAIARFARPDIETGSGIAWTDIERIARELYRAPSAAVYGRMGVCTQTFGSLCQWLIQLLNLYTGNLDRAGGCLVNQPALPLTGPGTPAGHYGLWRSRVRGLPEFAGELPVSVLAEEIRTPGEGQIRALLTVAGNPVLSTPDGQGLETALTGLDFMMSIDIYVNETTRHADLILPPASPLSQTHYDLIFNAFAVRRVARLNRPLHRRGEDERGDWEILQALTGACAERMGKAHTPLPEPRQLIALGLRRGQSGLDLAALEQAEHGLDLGPLQPCLLDRLQTGSGAIECAPALLMQDLERLSSAGRDAKPEPDALQLIGRRSIRSNNSWMHNAPRLIKGKPRHQLLVHPDDLARRRLADGDRARLRSAVAEIEVDLQASSEMRPGVVCLPHGFGHAGRPSGLGVAGGLAGESYNELSDAKVLDAPSGNAVLSGFDVWLTPAEQCVREKKPRPLLAGAVRSWLETQD